MKQSYFDGGLGSYIVLQITNVLIVIFTIGLGTPWVIVRSYRWEIEHSVIEGRRLMFNGSAGSLFTHWILWWFLTVITLGIYSFWVHIKVIEWKTEHTYFAA
ncbi:MAG: DUF898 family protein [Erysipelothrix sp.]